MHQHQQPTLATVPANSRLKVNSVMTQLLLPHEGVVKSIETEGIYGFENEIVHI